MIKADKKGFTLAELLIIVAVIAVLVAIAIPVFTSQLEKSREAVDLANARSKYAEVMTAAITDDKDSELYDKSSKNYVASFALKQKVDGWTTKENALAVGECKYISDTSGETPVSKMINLPQSGGTCTVTYDTSLDTITIDWGGETQGTHVIDPGNSYSVGNGIYEYVLGKLIKYNNKETLEDNYTKLFKSTTDTTCNDEYELPNGTKVQVSTFSRNYDSFEDVINRITQKDKATLLYNRSGQLSTIIYWDGTEWMCWQANKHDGSEVDYDGWKDEDNWQKNTYTTYKKNADGADIIQHWELKGGTAVIKK